MRRWLVFLALVLATPAWSQPPGVQQQQQRRERIKKRIQTMRNTALIDGLGLDEATAGKMLLVFAKYDEEFEKLLGSRADLVRKLQGVTERDPKGAVDKLLDEAIANQRALWDVEERRMGELRKILTPAQAARLVLLLPPLERKIQNQLRKAVAGGGGGGGGDDDKSPD